MTLHVHVPLFSHDHADITYIWIEVISFEIPHWTRLLKCQ